MDANDIEKLRQVFNQEHPSEKPIQSGSVEKVWKQIQGRLHAKCTTKTPECVVANLLEKQKAPGEWEKNPKEWLSSIDIEKVEKEFERIFYAYKFLGAIPIDFDKKSSTGKCVVDALCSTNIKDLFNKGVRKIGIVFNTDKSTGPGEHWIALFADIDPKYENARITYFDSYKTQPEKEIKRLMFRWQEQLDSMKLFSKQTQLTFNNTRHQYEDSECGMYCLYFHFCCMAGVPMEKRIPDEVVRAFRNALYSI
jgi:hypothetical protein